VVFDRFEQGQGSKQAIALERRQRQHGGYLQARLAPLPLAGLLPAEAGLQLITGSGTELSTHARGQRPSACSR
ncbi:hypothetical protein LNK15_14280, partial [Jeotgalicoccus huakuii]|nr:hypothetical protein [Jeotgalicoccus huakuii]